MKELILQQLDCFNDTEFKFDPKFHKYTYHGEQFISVTKFIQKFHKPFETDFWSKKKAEQAGVSQEEILNDWKKLNDYANEVGTDTHQWIEDYFLQLTAYALAHNEVYGTNIRKGVVLMCVKPEVDAMGTPITQPQYQEFVLKEADFDHWEQQWWKRLELYYLTN